MDDATGKPMYHLVIVGDFTYGSDHTSQLQMIVDADGGAGAFTDPNDNVIDQINLNKS
jgi:hypothetical protein